MKPIFINCPNCGTRNFYEDRICGVCHSQLLTGKNSKEKKISDISKKKDSYFIGFVILFILSFFIFIIYMIKKEDAFHEPISSNIPANLEPATSDTSINTNTAKGTIQLKYTVVEVRQNDSKTLDIKVSIPEKIREDELSFLAKMIKEKFNAGAHHASIYFALPGRTPDNEVWASAKFWPDLKIRYFSTSKENEIGLDKNPIKKDFVGVWDYTEDLSIVIKWIGENDYIFNYVSTTNLADASSQPINLKKVTRNGQTIYKEVDQDSKFYYKIRKNGDLLIYNEEGLESTLKKIK